MTQPTPDHEALLKRIEKLENQKYLLLFVCFLALAFAGASLYVTRLQPRELETEKIVFRDAQSNRHVSLAVDDKGSLNILDRTGVKRAAFGTADKNAFLLLCDPSGRPRTKWWVARDQGCGIQMLDERSTARLDIGYTLLAGPALNLSDEHGQMRSSLGILTRTGAALMFITKDNHPSTTVEQGGVFFRDENGNVLLSFPPRRLK